MKWIGMFHAAEADLLSVFLRLLDVFQLIAKWNSFSFLARRRALQIGLELNRFLSFLDLVFGMHFMLLLVYVFSTFLCLNIQTTTTWTSLWSNQLNFEFDEKPTTFDLHFDTMPIKTTKQLQQSLTDWFPLLLWSAMFTLAQR